MSGSIANDSSEAKCPSPSVMYLNNIRQSIEAAFRYSIQSDQPCSLLINWLENVLKDILIYSVAERYTIKYWLLKQFCVNFNRWRSVPEFLALINFITETNIRWISGIVLHGLRTVEWPDVHATICGNCFYEDIAVRLIEEYALAENLERRWGLFYYRRV